MNPDSIQFMEDILRLPLSSLKRHLESVIRVAISSPSEGEVIGMPSPPV